MKQIKNLLFLCVVSAILMSASCDDGRPDNTSALDEQSHTESNQQRLLKNQPLPDISWSMERDNLIKLKKLQNDRTINFFLKTVPHTRNPYTKPEKQYLFRKTTQKGHGSIYYI